MMKQNRLVHEAERLAARISLEEASVDESDGRWFLLGPVPQVVPSGQWDDPWVAPGVTFCPKCRAAGCEHCGWNGSLEVLNHEIFRDALETAAQRRGWEIVLRGTDPPRLYAYRASNES